MDEELETFLRIESEQVAGLEAFELGLDITTHESTGQVLEALYATSLIYAERAQPEGKDEAYSLARAIDAHITLHEQGVDIIDYTCSRPSSLEERYLNFALIDAVSALDAYKLLVEFELNHGNTDAKISDDILDESLSKLFKHVLLSGGDTEMWLDAMRLVMPHSKLLGDYNAPLDEVMSNLASVGMDYEAEEVVIQTVVHDRLSAIRQAIDEQLTGENDAKKDVLSALHIAIVIKKYNGIHDDDFELEQLVPTGISKDVFTKLLERSIQIINQ